MSTNHKTETTKPKSREDSFRNALLELEGMRDDIRVRIHLAGMELKQAWPSLYRLTCRRYVLGLSDEGTATLRRGRRVVTESARELLAPLDDDEVDTLVDLLARVAASEGVESPGF